MKTKATIGGTAHFSIQDHFKAIERVRQGLKEAILACPGPSSKAGITTLAPRCASVSFSKLVCGENFSAATYIFPAQYKALAELVDSGTPNTIVRRLLKTLNDGAIKLRDQKLIRLHPEVIANVRKMLKETV